MSMRLPMGARSRAFAALTNDNTIAYILLDRDATPIWVSPSLFTLVDLNLAAEDPWTDAMHPEDAKLSQRVFAEESAGAADDTYTVERRFEQIARMRAPNGTWRRFALRLLNFVNDPDVDGFLLQATLANQESSTVAAFDLAAAGADVGEIVSALLDSLESGGTGRSLAAAFDPTGRCIGASPSAPIGVGDEHDDPRWMVELEGRLDLRLPIVSQRNGDQLGTVETCSSFPDLRPFTESLTHSVVQRIALILDSESNRRELLRDADVDVLTGLANRRAFRNAMRKININAHISIAFIDVNSFKHVNDQYGHEIGDEVLVELAKRLVSLAHPSDIVARLGGDEFVFVRVNDHDHEHLDAAQFRQHLCWTSAHEPSLQVSCSVGVASGPAENRSSLLAQADAAMYEAKRNVVRAPVPMSSV